jgi:hypothetical protein
MYIYVNGEMSGSGNGRPADNGGLRVSSSPVSIGSKRLGNQPAYEGTFTGTIDEVAIYTNALSASEVQGHYGAAYGNNLSPQIVIQPTGVTNYVGLPGVLEVSAVGTVPLTYQWKKNGVDILGATEAIYTIPSLVLSDEDVYSVGITNSVGFSNSFTAYLDVLPTPVAAPAIPGLVMLHQFENTLTDSTGRGNNGTGMHHGDFDQHGNAHLCCGQAGFGGVALFDGCRSL